MIARAEAEARVERGAALLDRERPGWQEDVDPFTLRIESCERCVLGQLYGDYTAGFSALTGPETQVPGWRQMHGFAINRGETEIAFWVLTDAWIAAIAARRVPVTEAPTLADEIAAVECEVGETK